VSNQSAGTTSRPKPNEHKEKQEREFDSRSLTPISILFEVVVFLSR